MIGVKDLWMHALANLRRSWWQVLGAHVAFTALGFVVFAPLLGVTGRLLLRLSDQPALADQDIAYFLLSPPGLIALVVFAALLIGILAFEQAALMRIALSVMHGRRQGTLDALLYTAAQAYPLLMFSAGLVARVLLLTLPFLAVGAGIALFLITDYDINYYLSERPPEFWTAAVGIGAVLVAMVVLLVHKLLGWSLALPLVLFGGVAPAASFRESVAVTGGHRTEVLAALSLWAAGAIVLQVAVLWGIDVLGSWTVPGARGSISALVVLLGGLALLWMSANFVVTCFTSGSFAYLLMGLYRQLGPALVPADYGESELAVGSKTRRFTPATAVLALVATVVVAGATGVALLRGIRIDDTVTVVAHRGAAGKAPENTLAAVRQAIEDRADWVEIDVQESADGEIVVVHDSDFMKLAGDPTKVWDASLAALRDIDIGSWFDPAFSGERVPTLTEVLEVARGQANVVIELKYYGHDQNLEQRVVDIVEAAGMVDATAIMSLKYEAVQKVRALRPDWRIGLLSATAIGDLSRLDADFLAVAMGMASAGFVRRAQAAGRQVFVWTVNDPVSMSRMMSLGVDGIITDEPEMARQVLAQRADLGTVERLLIHAAVLFGKPVPSREYRDDSP